MQHSGAIYLETIYLLQRERGQVKSVDVARALSFTKPSVCRAMGKLKDAGYVEIEEGSTRLLLTKEGTKLAKSIVDRQETLTQFFMMTADVDLETAEEDAKKIMHTISDKTMKGIKSFIKQVEEMNE